MKTYTIAYGDNFLAACEPDGSDIEEAIRLEEDNACVEFDGLTVEEGLILTDSLLEGDEVRFASGPGDLRDSDGRFFFYAVRRTYPSLDSAKASGSCDGSYFVRDLAAEWSVPSDAELGDFCRSWSDAAIIGASPADYLYDAGIPTEEDDSDDAEALRKAYWEAFEAAAEAEAEASAEKLRDSLDGFIAQYGVPGESCFRYEWFAEREHADDWCRWAWDQFYEGQGSPYCAFRPYAEVADARYRDGSPCFVKD